MEGLESSEWGKDGVCSSLAGQSMLFNIIVQKMKSIKKLHAKNPPMNFVTSVIEITQTDGYVSAQYNQNTGTKINNRNRSATLESF